MLIHVCHFFLDAACLIMFVNLEVYFSIFVKVDRYFSKMYSEPLTPEQVNHNALLLVAACREMSLNYDIQVINTHTV